jgi:hypothetical protein
MGEERRKCMQSRYGAAKKKTLAVKKFHVSFHFAILLSLLMQG